MTPKFQAKIPPQLHTLFCGKAHWTRAPRYRSLAEPVDPRKFTMGDAWYPPQT
jgi:hypothetical protein